jgi:O-antigen ligase
VIPRRVAAPRVPRFSRQAIARPQVLAPPHASMALTLTNERTLLWFLVAHAILGALTFGWRPVATVHAWATLAGGLWVALTTRQPLSIAAMATYVVGAEVLWRMGRASVPWEIGKYAVVALFLIGLVRFRVSRPSYLAIGYFALLVPGAFVAAQIAIEVEVLRQQISFNLSGPLSLVVAACFFRQMTLASRELGGILVAALGPVIAIAALTVLSTYSATNIVFWDASNMVTSGGYGPNQVSGILSMGVVFCFLLLTTRFDSSFRLRSLLLLSLAVCGVQSAMTFSRGGLYMASIAMTAAAVFLLAEPRVRRIVLTTMAAMVTIVVLLAPQLNRFTGGALATRFQDSSLTSRRELMGNELQVWGENPWLGVGVGEGAQSRAVQQHSGVAAHTEWTRMLGEHGALGLAAMLMLLLLMAFSVARAPGPLDKAVAIALVSWGAAFLTANAMRIAAPGFLIGLSCATFVLSPPMYSSTSRRRRAQS